MCLLHIYDYSETSLESDLLIHSTNIIHIKKCIGAKASDFLPFTFRFATGR